MRPEDIVIALLNIKALLPITEEGHFYGNIIDIVAARFTALEPEEVSKYRYDTFTSDGILKGKCPNCKEYVSEKENCCHRCGQRLDWSNYHE